MGCSNIAGNYYNKYESMNPVTCLLMKGFHNAFDHQFKMISSQVSTIIDAGCGEGYISKRVAVLSEASILAFDLSPKIIETAKRINSHPSISYSTNSITNEECTIEPADLVICLEVLEHLENPESALKILSDISVKYVLLSVPNEPIWRVLNLARGKYLSKMGNTPGHLNHWTPKQFRLLVSQYFEVVDIRTPFPWTMILCCNKSAFRDSLL